MNSTIGSPNKHRDDAVELAGIQYAGVPGSTQDCLNAVIRLLQCRAGVSRAQILTSSKRHGILLSIDPGDLVAIKSGFASGYPGEGPSGFSRVLCLLMAHDVEIDEYSVTPTFIERLDKSGLTHHDLQWLESTSPIRPSAWSDYIRENDHERALDGTLWSHWCEPIIPLAVIDSRIFDLAKSFWEDPDSRLLAGYRRLEDAVRHRTGIDGYGVKLFTAAFRGNPPKLSWNGCNSREQEGRASLFTGAYMAYRNSRAHQELKEDRDRAIAELLMLNHLFRLENQASTTQAKLGVTVSESLAILD